MKILFVTGWFPLPVDNGAKIRIFNLLRGLCQQHEVTLLAFYRQENEPELLPHLREMCAKVEIIPWREFNPKSLRSQIGYFSPRPRSLLDRFSPKMQALISQELYEGHTYQLGIVSEIPMLSYLSCFQKIPLLLEDLELAVLYDKIRASSSVMSRVRNRLTLWKTSHFIANNLNRFRACTVVSHVEKAIVNEIAPLYQNVHIVPNCVDFNRYEGFVHLPKAKRLVFTGSLSYPPNYNAVVYFLDQVWPLVKIAVPDVQFWITGKLDNVQLPATTLDSQVYFTGYVEDIRPVIAGSAVSVVPLFAGSGTRLKILEALALNTAVVSTHKGAEGLMVVHQEHLLLADTPQEFADSVIRLLQDEVYRVELSNRGRELVQKKYNWEVVLPIFLNLVEQAGQSGDNINGNMGPFLS